MDIPMTDLRRQYAQLKDEIDEAVLHAMAEARFINGPQVQTFCAHLADRLNTPHVIPCGNGTDAIRLALKALELKPGDEVILPAFNYIAAVEMVVASGFEPVLIDVEPDTFNMNMQLLESALSRQTKAIIAVHLFGQACDMETLMRIAGKYKIPVIEDNAQSLGAECLFSDGSTKKAGTVAHIGTASFFPTKPLACYGDGGAAMTADHDLAERIRLLANHGQTEKYHHKIVGSNSRLDTIQAAILDVKLKHMDAFAEARRTIAQRYDRALKTLDAIRLPRQAPCSTHVFHQYTLRVKDGRRNALRDYLNAHHISAAIYYPLPVHEQEAYKWIARVSGSADVASQLCKEVISLPIYPEMTTEEQDRVIETLARFFSKT
jgi:dTDP-4-amino-4,6-dideoxygalactose transaminase